MSEYFKTLIKKAHDDLVKNKKSLKTLETAKPMWLKNYGLDEYKKERRRILRLVKVGKEYDKYLRNKRSMKSLRYRRLKYGQKLEDDEKKPQKNITGVWE